MTLKLDYGKDCLWRICKGIKIDKLLLYLGSGSHGDHSTGLFGGHKGFYDGQWLLTGRYFKSWLLISKNNKFLSKKNISFASDVDWKKKHSPANCIIHTTHICWMEITFIHAEQMSFIVKPMMRHETRACGVKQK